MDGTPPDRPRDRPFDPSRTARGEASRTLVADVLQRIESAEDRKRARREVDQRSHEAMVTALVLDLTHLALVSPGRALAVPLQKAMYSAKTRATPFLMETFPSLVRQVAQIGLVELELGHRSPFGTGTRSTVRAGDQMRQLIASHGVSLGDIGHDSGKRRDLLVLKGRKVLGKALKLAVPNNEETQRQRLEMRSINEWLAETQIDWLEDDRPVDITNRFLQRIFNNGRMDHCGRLYGGFWQNGISAEMRLNGIWIDGEPVASLDFGQMGIRTAYALAKVAPPQGDLYAIPGLEQYREGVKTVLSAMLASDKVPQRFPKGTRKLFPSTYSFADVLRPILSYHAALARFFGTGLAYELMHIESNLMVSILLRLKERGIAALPIHDCLLVSQQHSKQVKQVMEDSFRQMLGWEGVVEESLPTVTYTFSTPSESYWGEGKA